MLCIVHNHRGGTSYLSYQECDRSYFWTDKDTFAKILHRNTKEHPILFNTRREAITHLKTLNIPQRCRIVVWDWTDEDEIHSPTKTTTEKNTDTARFMEYLESAIDKANQAISSISYSSYPEINKDPIATLRQAITLMTDALDMEIHKPVN